MGFIQLSELSWLSIVSISSWLNTVGFFLIMKNIISPITEAATTEPTTIQAIKPIFVLFWFWLTNIVNEIEFENSFEFVNKFDFEKLSVKANSLVFVNSSVFENPSEFENASEFVNCGVGVKGTAEIYLLHSPKFNCSISFKSSSFALFLQFGVFNS